MTTILPDANLPICIGVDANIRIEPLDIGLQEMLADVKNGNQW
jgi:hypothetical protein